MTSETNSPLVTSQIKETTLANASMQPFGSTPLSYLFEASVDKNKDLALFLIVTGSK